MTTKPLLLGIREAARELGVSRDRAYELVRSGEIRSVAIGAKRLVPRVELDRWIERALGGEDGVQTGSGVESGPRRVETRA